MCACVYVCVRTCVCVCVCVLSLYVVIIPAMIVLSICPSGYEFMSNYLSVYLYVMSLRFNISKSYVISYI